MYISIEQIGYKRCTISTNWNTTFVCKLIPKHDLNSIKNTFGHDQGYVLDDERFGPPPQINSRKCFTKFKPGIMVIFYRNMIDVMHETITQGNL